METEAYRDPHSPTGRNTVAHPIPFWRRQSSQQARTSVRVGGASRVLTFEKIEAKLEVIVSFGPFLKIKEVEVGEQIAVERAIGGKDGSRRL